MAEYLKFWLAKHLIEMIPIFIILAVLFGYFVFGIARIGINKLRGRIED